MVCFYVSPVVLTYKYSFYYWDKQWEEFKQGLKDKVTNEYNIVLNMHTYLCVFNITWVLLHLVLSHFLFSLLFKLNQAISLH